jgi:hypothetical protein
LFFSISERRRFPGARGATSALLESYAPRPAEAARQRERAARFASLYAGVAPLYAKD